MFIILNKAVLWTLSGHNSLTPAVLLDFNSKWPLLTREPLGNSLGGSFVFSLVLL